MKFSSVQFTQINRLFSASAVMSALTLGGRVCMWGLLICALYINISMVARTPGRQNTVASTILLHPLSPIVHQEAATEFWKLRAVEKTKQELLLTQSLAAGRSGTVLGVATSPKLTVGDIESLPDRQRNSLREWLDVIAEKPDYRDAYLQAALNAFLLGNYRVAGALAQKAMELDPNFIPTTTLLLQIQNVLGK